MNNHDEDAGEKEKPAFDLEERTARFGEAVIAPCKTIPKNVVTIPLIDQLVRSSTSIGANYCEADEAISKKDFRFKIGLCKKESRETKHWLRMLAKGEEGSRAEARSLWMEAKQLTLIFAAIYRK
ncbi:MAG TPA: four helix bundle protein [Gemmataceae bacterium]|nr:four helix bundle protein [Gemmataceae bacterium]